MIGLFLLPLAIAAPLLQAPFSPVSPTVDVRAADPVAGALDAIDAAPSVAPEALRAGFSSKGAGIPVLHDLCSGHALVSSLHAASATVYVYHDRRRGFCVSLFAPDTPVSVAVTTPELAPAAEAARAEGVTGAWTGSTPDLSEDEGGDDEDPFEFDAYLDETEPHTSKPEGAKNADGDEAAWTGRGAMPGSLRLRSDAACVRVRADVGGEHTDAEVCLGR